MQAGKIADDLGIMDGAMGNKAPKRAPPRRAVTWVNEIRCVRPRHAASLSLFLDPYSQGEVG